VEAIEMLEMVATPPVREASVWMVQLGVEFPGAVRPAPGEGDLEPMVELMTRTEGVSFAVVVPLRGGLAVATELAAPDATTALDRARTLVCSCARYAGLGEVEVARARATSQSNAEGA
jgi:hypothetical protein